MSKIRVAVLAGGYSSERGISLQSAGVVCESLNPEKFSIYLVEVTESKWTVKVERKSFPIDLNNFGFHNGVEHIEFDVVFNAIHGDPGENGKIQGYLEMFNIPHTSCSQSVSALTFNKWQCNTILKKFGFDCAPSVLIQKGDEIESEKIVTELGLPVFVKPNNAGSSFGVSKVKELGALIPAINEAMKEDSEVVIEAFMDGIEVGCGVFRHKGEFIALPPTEIRSHNEFFDYEAKYLGKSEEITPAEIASELIEKVKNVSAEVYDKINASGCIRVDFMLVEGIPKIIEVNTVPGFSSESIVPQQAKCAGYTLSEFFEMLIIESMS